MKIAVTATGPTFDHTVEARFGRCAYFLIVDTDTMQYEPIENPNIALGGGAGIQSAQLMSEKGVTAVLTGNCGPNAFNVFGQAGIRVIVGVSGPVCNAVEQFKRGAFSSALEPNVASHSGLNTSLANPTPMGRLATGPLGQRGGMGLGMGGGRGMGRGMRGARSMDKGMGCGGGTRRGMGRGIGRRRGVGMGASSGVSYWPTAEQVASLSESGPDPEQAKAFLREQVQILEQQKRQIQQRISVLETGPRSIAVVVPEKCAGCGICVDVCPAGAIEVTEKAVINDEICIGCAACMGGCPNQAIIITQKQFSK
jgi:predicted Fe-Mo cluster-binding NifX family protein/ferredoxin